MDLEDTSQLARTQHTGKQEFAMSAGKSLKIETSPAGEDILDVEVPAGKTWSVKIWVEIIET